MAVTMGPRKKAADVKRCRKIVGRLKKLYPDAHCALKHRTSLQLLVATILSAQCTDVRVNQVTPSLFKRYPTAAALADSNLDELEQIVRPTGFFRNKARAIQGSARKIVDEHGGKVPQTMEQLLKLPGVARKTANVVLGTAFGIADGVVVDTHVKRLSARLGFSRHTDPKKIESDLMGLFPRQDWINLSFLLIDHGRQVCQARKPKCHLCALTDLCVYYQKTYKHASAL